MNSPGEAGVSAQHIQRSRGTPEARQKACVPAAGARFSSRQDASEQPLRGTACASLSTPRRCYFIHQHLPPGPQSWTAAHQGECNDFCLPLEPQGRALSNLGHPGASHFV